MYCFDTNIIIDIFRGDNDLKAKLEKFSNTLTDVFLTPITLCELYKGAYLHHNPIEKIREIEDFLSSFTLLEFDQEAAKKFGKEYSKLSKMGKLISEFDLMIACIVKMHDLILITRDKKHFENIDVKIEVL